MRSIFKETIGKGWNWGWGRWSLLEEVTRTYLWMLKKKKKCFMLVQRTRVWFLKVHKLQLQEI